MDIVKVNNLSKKYHLGSSGFTLTSALFTSMQKNDNANVYALKQISFSVKQGEAFAIIGRNGSGKSTLLQIIAGTLKPSEGSVSVNGRVSALLELGSGFNPDFTGRENIYLYGSILGISSYEMDKKIDEIESFADIGKYITEPVRTYSTGMLMRVAFAVAIAVEPDLLIIDEALSVGDILFQQKCNNRLKELVKKGISLLVVTHDTSFVLNICQKALWVHEGKTKFIGSASECVQRYLIEMAAIAGNNNLINNAIKDTEFIDIPLTKSLDLVGCKKTGIEDVVINRMWLLNSTGTQTKIFNVGEWCIVLLELFGNSNCEFVSAGCELRDRHGQVVFATGLRVVRKLITQLKIGERKIVEIKFQLNIAPAQYTLDVGCGSGSGQNNTGFKYLAAAILETRLDADDDIVHGIVRLPYEIKVSNYQSNSAK